ncbi:unnamed protein product, partial [marine sediment metagenome]
MQVEADGDLGGKCLMIDSLVGGRYFASWDKFGDTHQDVEILARARDTFGYDHTPRFALRGSGSDGNEKVYFAGFQTPQDENFIHKYTPTSTSVGSIEFVCSKDVWYWVRFRVEGNSLKTKAWRDGDGEPAWMIEETDDSHTQGWVGIGSYNSDPDFDWVGVATGGMTVPSPYLWVENCSHDNVVTPTDLTSNTLSA